MLDAGLFLFVFARSLCYVCPLQTGRGLVTRRQVWALSRGQSLVSTHLGRQVKALSRQLGTTGLSLVSASRGVRSRPCAGAVRSPARVQGSVLRSSSSRNQEQWQCKTKTCTGMLDMQEEALHGSGGWRINAPLGPIGRIRDGGGSNRFPAHQVADYETPLCRSVRFLLHHMPIGSVVKLDFADDDVTLFALRRRICRARRCTGRWARPADADTNPSFGR